MNNSYWKFKKTSPIKWLTNELSFYIDRWDNDSEEVRKEHIKFLLSECAFFEKDYSVEFLNWVRENHYDAKDFIKVNVDWTFIWSSESDNHDEYTSEQLYDKFEKR